MLYTARMQTIGYASSIVVKYLLSMLTSGGVVVVHVERMSWAFSHCRVHLAAFSQSWGSVSQLQWVAGQAVFGLFCFNRQLGPSTKACESPSPKGGTVILSGVSRIRLSLVLGGLSRRLIRGRLRRLRSAKPAASTSLRPSSCVATNISAMAPISVSIPVAVTGSRPGPSWSLLLNLFRSSGYRKAAGLFNTERCLPSKSF
jgi:hypothetical protein